jgi:hypothetical protein
VRRPAHPFDDASPDVTITDPATGRPEAVVSCAPWAVPGTGTAGPMGRLFRHYGCPTSPTKTHAAVPDETLAHSSRLCPERLKWHGSVRLI